MNMKNNSIFHCLSIRRRSVKAEGETNMKKLMTLMAVLAALAAGSSAHAQVDVYWSGAAADNNWDNVANWSASPLNNFAHVDTLTAYPIITVSNTILPNDIKIAAPIGSDPILSPTGRVDVLSGALRYRYWSFVGDWQGNGTLNIADTSGSGGTYTGYGLGSGSFVSTNAAGNNNTMVGLYQSTGVINMNTTGSLEAQNLHISPNGQGGSGTFNLDAGTVNVSGNMWVGSDFWEVGTVSDGHFNMSGGEVNVGGNFEVGHLGLSATNGTSDATIAGGTLNVETDLKVGFAGTNTTAIMTVKDGATVNVASTNGTRWVVIGQWDPTGPSTLILSNGATLNLNDGTDIMFKTENNTGPRMLTVDGSTINGDTNGGSYMNLQNNGTPGGTSTLNIRNGAVVAVDAIVGYTNDTVNFDNGTLKATANDPYFLGDNMTINIGSGGVTFDTDGHTNTVRGELLDGSSGGGMTKRGTGSLSLIGGFNYTGSTRLEQGSLSLDTGASPACGSMVISNGTTLSFDTANGDGTLEINGDVNFYGTTTLNVNYGAGASPVEVATALGYNVTSSGGTCTINVTGTALEVGTYTLFLTATPVSTANFALTYPSSITAHLEGTSDGLYLVVDTAGKNLVWYGADDLGTTLLNTWNTTLTNWNAGAEQYTEYGTYSDNVRFDDDYAFGLAGVTNVNLSSRVVPQSVTFYSDYDQPYTLTGTGGIDGSTSLLLSNTVSLFLGTSNSYTGGTIVGAGTTLTITNDNALGTNSGVVTLNGGTLDVAANITGVHPITTTAASSINVASGSTATLNGTITANSPVAKRGAGTMGWSANQSLNSSLRVVEGSVGITGGSTTLGGSPSSVGYQTNSGAMTLSGGATLTALQDFWVGGTDQAAAGHDATGTMTVSGGTAYFGGPGGQVAHYNGGSLQLGANIDNLSSASGTMTVSGGTVWCTNNLDLGFAGANGTTGTLNLNGTGTVNVGLDTARWLVLGKWDWSSGTLNVSGGNLNLMNNSSIAFTAGADFGGGWGTNVVNQTGGTVTFYSDAGVTVGGTGDGVNLARAGQVPARNTYNLDGGLLITPQISGTDPDPVKAFNFNGGTLRAARDNANFINLGGGTNVVNVRNNGALIDTAGYNVTSVNALQHSTVGGDAATDGGLTKSGLGTLTLASTNNYTGPTVVNAGQLLVVNGSATPGAVTVADGASFGVSSSSASGTATVGNVALGSTTGGDLSFSYSFNGNPTAAALTAGTVTVASGSTVALAGAFEVGTFPILDYTGALSPLPTLNPPRGTAASLSNDASGTVLYVVVTAVGAPIVWDGLYGPLTNVWDINITSNWVFSATQTTYLEPLPPGDNVLFDDSGSGTVLLSNAVSPAAVLISNVAKAYTFQGSGGIAGSAGVTKEAAGTATMAYPGNTYSGATRINGGTLVASGGSAIGDSSAVTLADVSGAGLVITNGTETIASLAGGGSTGGDIDLASSLLINGSTNTTYGGAASGTGWFMLEGTGTLTVTGSIATAGQIFVGGGSASSTPTMNIESGATVSANDWWVVGRDGSAGTVNVNGGTIVHTGGGNLTLGTLGTTPSGTINLNSGAISNLDGAIYLGEGSSGSTNVGTLNQYGGVVVSPTLQVGNFNNAVGTLNQTNGTMTLANMNVGLDYGTVGLVNFTGGTMNVTNFLGVGVHNQFATPGKATFLMSTGATLNAAALVVPFSGSTNTTGVLTNDGGIINITGSYLEIARWDVLTGGVTLVSGEINLLNNANMRFALEGNSGAGTFNQNGGSVTFYSDGGTTVGGTGYLDMDMNSAGGNPWNESSGTYTYNLNAGTLTVPRITTTEDNTNGTTVFNFDGGTLVAAGGSPNFLENLTYAYVRANGATIDTAGYDIIVNQPLLDGTGGGGLIKNGDGMLSLNGTNTYTGNTVVNAGTLGGNGVIAGTVQVGGSGTLTAGNSIGLLTLNSAPTLGGSVLVEVDRAGSPSRGDVINLTSGTLTYGGTLVISNAGAPLVVGDSFTNFTVTGSSYAGSFVGTPVSLTPGQTVMWDTSQLTVNGSITATNVVTAGPTTPVPITFSLSGGTLTLNWPESGWYLQAQTNALSAGLQTNTLSWYTLPGYDTGTNATISVDTANPTVFYRLRNMP